MILEFLKKAGILKTLLHKALKHKALKHKALKMPWTDMAQSYIRYEGNVKFYFDSFQFISIHIFIKMKY